uniref:Uncharacterized protein n=1 Tax=Fabrea salina TaxID=342563 RepID=A0A7S3I9M7_9CILI
MDCPDGKGWYSLGINPALEELGKNEYTFELKKYPGHPVELTKNEEYAYGTCSSKTENLDQAVYKHRPKSSVLSKPKHSKPLIILNLTLDSVSRRFFYRKLSKTVEFLNNLQGYTAFDFKIHNVMGEWSASNVVPQVCGDILFKMHRERIYEDLFYDNSLWKYANDSGFATMFIEEGCTDDLSKYLGRRLRVDHIVTSFYCAAGKFSGFKNNLPDQRCIGHHNSHVYVYNYISEFSKNYKGIHQWIYSHINTAHEKSGTVINTLDLDTLEFLKSYLQENKDSQVVVFLTGDHGMRYGDWFKKVDGAHEHRLPLGVVIASDSLLESIEGVYDTLTHNSRRLTSKLDLYTSQLHLVAGTKKHITRDSKDYLKLKSTTSREYKPISLFLEKVPNNRTCEDVKIPSFWCSCLKMQEVKETEYPEFIYKIAQEVVYQINEETNSPKTSPYSHICQKLSLKEITKLQVLATKEEYYKMQFTVNESDSALFETVVLVTSKKYNARNINEAYPFYPYFFRGKNFKVMYIRRVDSYAGVCEDLCKAKMIEAELCICHPLEYILEKEPHLKNYLGTSY